jgi:predicted AlkP superfamily pyrophosphatase or phosphodiesterase
VTGLRRILLSCGLALAGCTAPPQAQLSPRPAEQAEIREPVTILISIDGFRADYLERGITPHLRALAERGVSAAMRPSFPTKTFPNHYTLVTGLRPDRHGIVDNIMEDPRRPRVTFTPGDPVQALDPFWWEQAEPIWTTAERSGIRTATLFWPGSELAIGGIRPSTWQRFHQDITGAQRVEAAMDWLRRPAATRPRFAALYFDTVDTAGHDHGPHAPGTDSAIAEVDARIGDLVAGLEALGQPANIVVVADHGMAATAPERVVPIASLVDPAKVRIIGEGSHAGFQPLEGKSEAVAQALLRPRDHVACWRRSEIPARFHYGVNPRVPAFLCLAETGWLLTRPDRAPSFGGAHGYDNQAPDMLALFAAAGPAFRRGVRLPAFDNVDVYPLLARLIGIAPRPGDGGPALTAAALAE